MKPFGKNNFNIEDCYHKIDNSANKVTRCRCCNPKRNVPLKVGAHGFNRIEARSTPGGEQS
jgi:hypothetical protein